jgi:hypothetical protein
VITPTARARALRWLQSASALAAALGVGVAVSATWLAWRERFHAPVTGTLALSLAGLYGASGSGELAYRACERWAGSGVHLASAASITFLACAGVRALHASWFRWLGWVLAALLLVLAIAGFLAGAATALVGGADPSVTKTEPAWQIAVGGAALIVGSMGALIGSAVLGGLWLIAVGGGATRWIRAKVAPGPV